MKKFIFAALPLAALFGAAFLYLAPTAQAQFEEPEANPESYNLTYSCKPESFTLTQNGTSFTLQGRIETPTPGYSYEFTSFDAKFGRVKATLKLSGVDNAVIQVLDGIDVSHSFEHAGMLHALSIKVEKDFNWGPASISCSHQ
jgi:hypothetical protein